jgi:hypothetical protein
VPTIGIAGIVNRNDSWMTEPGRQARLVLKPLHDIWIRRKGGRENLERNIALQENLPGAIDRSHRSPTDNFLEGIWADGSSWPGCSLHVWRPSQPYRYLHKEFAAQRHWAQY